MISAKKELPEIYIYMVQSIDGKGSGEMLFAPESKFGMKYYFENQYSWGCKSILLGRTTCQIFLRDKEIDYTGITTDNIDKKDYISENKKKQNIIISLLIKMENCHGPKDMGILEENKKFILFLF